MTAEIYLVRLSFDGNKPLVLMHQAMRHLSPERQQTISNLRFLANKRRAVAAETLIRSLLMQTFGLTNAAIHFERNPYGKSRLKGNPSVEFNLSHSGGWVACATDVHPVGIDVEQVLPIDYEEIAMRFFSQQEYDDLMRLTARERPTGFYRLWTLKESYIKAIGKGLVTPLDAFSVIADVQDGDGESTFQIEGSGADKYRLAPTWKNGRYASKD
ncbi:MAG: 4'-phosphopantetheinyl transferase superfamily protein [Candidatus Carbobacillus sp.]|nr:4'-phosphopantetheinyl transferase superfamily protein [Candidatus Carbobacillus sp.]